MGKKICLFLDKQFFFAYSACMILPLVLFIPRKICVKSKFAKFLTQFLLKISISTILIIMSSIKHLLGGLDFFWVS